MAIFADQQDQPRQRQRPVENGPDKNSTRAFSEATSVPSPVLVFHSSSAQCLPRLLNDCVVWTLVAVEVVHRGCQQVRSPFGTDPADILEHGSKDLVLVRVVARLAAK